jgi:lipoprotein-anchoring transpeptidase ErfK/SrfK
LLTIPSFSEVHSEKSQKIYIKVDLWTNELHVIEGEKVIRRYKISPGTEESPTPIGAFMITEKSKSWGGGFGTRWLGLDVPWGDYGIHGTNKPWLIGRNVSSGCIRMRNKDVEELFEIVCTYRRTHYRYWKRRVKKLITRFKREFGSNCTRKTKVNELL